MLGNASIGYAQRRHLFAGFGNIAACQRKSRQSFAAIADKLAVNRHQQFHAGFGHQLLNCFRQYRRTAAGGNRGDNSLLFKHLQSVAGTLCNSPLVFDIKRIVDIEKNDFGLLFLHKPHSDQWLFY